VGGEVRPVFQTRSRSQKGKGKGRADEDEEDLEHIDIDGADDKDEEDDSEEGKYDSEIESVATGRSRSKPSDKRRQLLSDVLFPPSSTDERYGTPLPDSASQSGAPSHSGD